MSASAWGGRFEKETAPLASRFGASVPFDWRLYRYDIAGSIAHARMLSRQGIISNASQQQIEARLRETLGQIEAGTLEWSVQREDVHMNIEAALGEAGRELHTARSRNDQVALDLRLFCREAAVQLGAAILNLSEAFIRRATEHAADLMPGYTHLQRAQPVTLGHHLLAYVEMLARDLERLSQAFDRLNVSPLGSGALAGVPYPIDRQFVADLLGFDSTSANSMDAVSDRDFALDLLAAIAISGLHLSRFAEEIIVWATTEFRFVQLDDAWSTGSSMMPQKKNADFAELIRGKSGRLYGDLVTVLTVLKGLPLTYNKDLQEDKEPLFDAVDTLAGCLEVAEQLLLTLRFQTDRMAQAAAEDYTTATDLADYLVRRGVPFRQAHHIVGQIVGEAVAAGRQLTELDLANLQAHSGHFQPEVLEAITAQASVGARAVPGGTAPDQVRAALGQATQRLAGSRRRVEAMQAICARVDDLLRAKSP
ncbi:MAG: argininosuccinate lyase [Chloroflexi bacterium]|nr:argininosuccinate lyase [Chloroflexota bacterium]